MALDVFEPTLYHKRVLSRAKESYAALLADADAYTRRGELLPEELADALAYGLGGQVIMAMLYPNRPAGVPESNVQETSI